MDFKNIKVKSYNLTNNQIVTLILNYNNEVLAYFFSSYGITICKIDWLNNIIYVHKEWNYSTTTAKWFNKFISIAVFKDESAGFNFNNQTEIKTKYKSFNVILLNK